MRFDITDLRLFIQVAEAGSITAGAERSNIALSAASARISGMEAELGVPLLERQRIGVRVTEAGHALLHHARTIDRQFARMKGELDEFAFGLKGHVRLFSNTNAETGMLPDILAAFLLDHPAVNIDLQEHLSEEIIQALLEGIADIGVLATGTIPEGLESFSIGSDRLVLICTPSHALAGRGSIEFSEVLDQDFIGLHEEAAMQAFLAETAAHLGRRMRFRMRLRGFDGVCRMVERGIGVAIVPLSSADFFRRILRLAVVPLADSWAERHLKICCKDAAELPPQGRKLVQFLALRATTGTQPTH
ncbi:LysR family transcriptional regulator [Mameliella alba]|uniref:LysR family transcriptional regulator n=1 Tax=Mameliella alba TaxID=561184 RepID=UPI001C96A6A0|nr:LysR family transcriptional regulator [Mameliella alba]MBY6122814.1 LysR family transcriptional regulator [Mameliella alba]